MFLCDCVSFHLSHYPPVYPYILVFIHIIIYIYLYITVSIYPPMSLPFHVSIGIILHSSSFYIPFLLTNDVEEQRRTTYVQQVRYALFSSLVYCFSLTFLTKEKLRTDHHKSQLSHGTGKLATLRFSELDAWIC